MPCLPPVCQMNARIENKRVDSAVPCNIHKADNAVSIVDTHMPETTGKNVSD
jgi:hypothetical protein